MCRVNKDDAQDSEVPWHTLENRASYCRFELVNYDEEARKEDK